jgi:hypothetical protein
MNGNKGISIKLNPSIIYIFGKKRLGTMDISKFKDDQTQWITIDNIINTVEY